MTSQTNTLRAADHLVDQLVTQGATHVFGVPGESYLPVLDAMHGREGAIEFVTCRQEGGAAMAADAHGKLTGRPGICMVTRGPGATNASAGVHVAFQDSTPMILFIGQVARHMVEREAFQEIDYRRMFGQMAKWVAEIDDASRIQEYVTRAFHVALSGRPGPVVLSLPEDMLYDEIAVPAAAARVEVPRFQPVDGAMAELQDRIAQAKRPLVIAGGGGWTQAGVAALAQFAGAQGLPVAASFRCQALMDNRHGNYAGHFNVGPTGYLNNALAETDLLIAIGPRLGEITTGGYTLMDSPVPKQDLVHVFPAGEELGRVFEPAQALVSDLESFCMAAAAWDPIKPEAFADRTAGLHASYEAFVDPDAVPGDPMAGHFAHLSNVLPDDAIIANGAGNYAAWLHRFFQYKGPHTQLAPTSGSMGYGLPGAVGAAATQPGREVFAIAGDGCFMMTCQEMATAAHHGLNLTVIVIDNARYGTIRAHQEREYPGRVSGTMLTNPDFCALARSFGATAVEASGLEDFKTALAEARARGGLNLIEIQQDRTFLAPGKKLAEGA